MRRGVQLYIAGRQVDLADDSWILFSWTREDLSNPTSTVNSSSNQITLPGTCRNNALLGSVFRLDRRTLFGAGRSGVNFDPMRKTPFMLYADDGAVLESGYCRLDAVNTRDRRHEYTVTLYGGLGSFFYGLAMKEDGTPRTLLDLTWQDADGEDIDNFVMTPQAVAVNDAWHWLSTGEYELYNIWNVINFAPAYNGLPENFDASHAISDHDAYFNVPQERNNVDGEETADYTYKTGLDCALLNFTNPHTEWEMCDLRWYLQRPVVSVKAFIAAICDQRNNGGYEVNLDEAFFNDANPAYADAWWTLPLISTADRENPRFLESLLRSSRSPMDYLTGYCKHFGLLFLWDSATHTVDIVTRATFYQQDFGGGVPEQGEETDTPTGYKSKSEGASYYSISNMGNAYADTTSTNYGTVNYSRGASAETHFYLTFDFSGIPADAVIKSVTVKSKAYANQSVGNIVSKAQGVVRGTTPVGAEGALVGSADVVTLDPGTGWTRQNIDDLAIHYYAIRPASGSTLQTNYTMRLYGAEVHVEYEIPAEGGTSLEVIDLTARIDRSQQITQDPVLADKRWYQFGDGGKGAFVEQYLRDYGNGYATQRIDTGYEFDAGTTVLTDGNAFAEAAEVAEASMLYTSTGVLIQTVGGWSWRNYLQLPRFEQVSVELWNAAGESRTFDVQCPVTLAYYDDPAHPGTDWLPKVQLHGEDNKAQDGADVLVFFTGFADTPSYGSGTSTIRKRYHLSNDSLAMQDLAGGPCWDLTFQWITLTALPSFRRVVTSGEYITDSWEWGVPRVRAVPGIIYPDGDPTALYDRWWKRYLRDRYATDTRVLTCRVDLRGLPVGQALMRRFFWIDGALWTLNAIRNHPMTSWDLTECEFVKVGDKGAYTQGPGNLGTHYIVISPSAASFTADPNGGTLTLTVRSSSAWALTSSGAGEWATFSAESGAAGASVLEITFQPNTTDARRSVNVTLTNATGDTVAFTVSQGPGTPASISLNPSSLEISENGTAAAGQADRGRSVGVTASGAWAVDTSTVPAWITFSANTTVNVLNIKASANDTGSARTAAIKVYLTSDPTVYATLAVSQAAGEGGTGGITLTDGNGNNSATAAAAGQTITLYVGNTNGQDWTLTKSESWGSLSRSSGTGDGTVMLTVPSTSVARDQIITATLSGKTQGVPFYLHQAAPAADPDNIEIVRYPSNWFYNNQTYSSSAQAAAATLTSSGPWTAYTPNSWIHPDGAWSGGSTSATDIWFDLDANNGAARTGTIVATLTGTDKTATFYVYQNGNTTRTLYASFNKSAIDASAQTIYLNIQATSGLAWTISNVSSGLSPASLSGTGPATIAVSVSAASAARTLSLTVSNSQYGLSDSASINQSAPAATDYLRVTPFGTINVGPTDTTFTFSVESSTSWQVTTPASGVTITPSSGSGNATVTVNIGTNTGTSERTIALTFATTNGSSISVPVTIVQAGSTVSTIEVTPSSVTLDAAGGSGAVSVTASAAWTAAKSDSWISLSTESGSAGTSSVTITARQNTGPGRTGTVTFTCGDFVKTVTVYQGTDKMLDVSSNAVAVGAGSGSSGSVTVYSSMPWQLGSLPSWLTASYPDHPGSTSGDTLTFTASQGNPSATARSATVRVSLIGDSTVYQDIVVTQAGASVIYVSPLSLSVGAEGAERTIEVSSNTAWTITSIPTGVTIPSGSQSGSGNATVPVTIAPNANTMERSMTIVFATNDGQAYTSVIVTQAAGQFSIANAVSMPASGERQTAVLVSTSAWSLNTGNLPSWLLVTPTSGGATSGQEIAFYADTNYSTTQARSATLTFTDAFGHTVTCTVTQAKHAVSPIMLTPENEYGSVLYPSTSRTGTVQVACSGAWTVTTEAESPLGITVSTLGGSGNGSINWTVTGISSTPRTARIRVRTMVRPDEGYLEDSYEAVLVITLWQTGN